MMGFLLLIVFISLMIVALGLLEVVCDFLCEHSQRFEEFLSEVEYRIFEEGEDYYE